MIKGRPMRLQSVGILTALFAQQSTAYALDVRELVDRHVAAIGGKAKIDALVSMRLLGRVTFRSYGDLTIDLAWSRTTKRQGMIREEASLQGLTAVYAFDGKEGWSIQPFEGRREPDRMSPDDSKDLIQQSESLGPLVEAQQKGFTLEYLGTEDVDGTPAHKIKVVRKTNDTQYVYLDPDYLLIIRVETHNLIRGSEVVTVADYGNYESVAGLWVPFAIESGPKNAPKDQWRVVEKAEANFSGIDEGWFRLPKKGAPAIASPGGPAVTALPGSSTPPKPVADVPARFDAGVVSGLGARNIGSAQMSGRIAALDAYNEGGKTTLFVGAASGGVWKSTDGGTTFKPVFDEMPVQSIGAITIDPSDHKIVWVGTGESWTRNSVSLGDGIYKSTDGGETWKHSGLPQSERITKIVVHPKNGNIVYACVPGALWSDSNARGLYKTVDGGKTWTLILKGANASTGCSGISLDPKVPDLIFAGTWDFRRKGWTFRSGGEGPEAFSGSGMFRSADGGKTWVELTAKTNKGLPEKPWGRVEVVHAPSDANIIYSFIEGKDSALFYSGDGGKTWEARDKSRNMIWRPFYFARLVVDPKNAQRVFKVNLWPIVSEDGGKSFTVIAGNSHADWHHLWIDPDNPKHIIGGDDGGLWISYDGGNRWWKGDNLPISQFYHVSVDDQDPYRVYGGLQDNSSWVGDSEYPGGIGNERWDAVFWGDGFHTLADPTDPDAVYAEAQGGYIARIDRKTRAIRDIQPKANYKEKLRFNWNTPIAVSPTQKSTLYLGAQFLFRSKDRGDSWERISPDLTTNDPERQKQELSGGITVDNSSAEMHTTIYSISESPKNPKVIWVGTDDGNIQLTKDGAKTWSNVGKNLKDVPVGSWVSHVEASRFDAAIAYATIDRHTFGDMDAYVYRTGDYGKTWTRIAGADRGLRGHAYVVKEDSQSRSILFVGTEFGLWITVDGGATWAEFKGGKFPAVSVRDLAVQPRTNDLVIGTHGRGIWIIDDVSSLRALTPEALAKPAAFLPVRISQQRMFGIGGWVNGDAKFVGTNPLGGAVLSYYQRSRHLFGPLALEILGPDGKVIDKIDAPKRRGINRVSWSMRNKPPRVPKAAQIAFNGSMGPRVLPGTYKVRLTSGREVLESKLEIALDRRAEYKVADRKAQYDASMRVHALFGRMSGVVDRIDRARGSAMESAAKLEPKDDLAPKLKAFAERLEALKKVIVATKEGGAITGEERLREHADILYGALMVWEGKPARYQLERIDALTKELGDVDTELGKLLATEVPALDAELAKRKLGPIPTQVPEHTEVMPRSSDLRSAMARFRGFSVDPQPARRKGGMRTFQ
jgi:photosystem II stability/assembly factor-like uncharacterized protein